VVDLGKSSELTVMACNIHIISNRINILVHRRYMNTKKNVSHIFGSSSLQFAGD